jgi:hypothetical protein
MARFFLLIFIVLSALGVSCSGRKTKLESSDLIPRKELTSILADIYIADGLLTLPKIRSQYSPADSLSPYNDIFEKHGYTREEMDRTMKYYFVKKPAVLIEIYDQVLGTLSELETRYGKEVSQEQNRAYNLWRGKETYSLPAPEDNDSTWFDLSQTSLGYYTLTFTVTLYPDDGSLNPRLTGYVCTSDSSETGAKHFLKPVYYLKDGYPHTYTIEINCSAILKPRLRGLFYTIDNCPDNMVKHILVSNILYTFSPTPL